ncbi:MAG: hypothetical protein OXT09_03080 [Myxococcales bacterium]|nr:hypothetical protein [Myxococcales bacterium]
MHCARLSLLGLCVLVACSTSERLGDAGLDEDGGTTERPATGDGDGPSGAEGFGAPCQRTSDCGGELFCDEEIEASFVADGLPDEQAELPASYFPGGICAPVPANPFDPSGRNSCNPLNAQPEQGCGQDGACIVLSFDQGQIVACRPVCEPSDDDDGGCGRFGYTCGFSQRVCIEGCQSDEECRLRVEDEDGDGAGDSLVYDEESEAICSPDTFRCELPSFNRAKTGDECERLDDCEANGDCIGAFSARGGFQFPGGFCTKVGCDVEDRECEGDGAVCEPLRPWAPGIVTPPLCLSPCTVGAEPEEDQLGVEGHGEGCREGYRCHYNGGPGAESGVCVGGNYNDREDNNLGAACDEDADCFSPFGLGSCLFLGVNGLQAPTGFCTVMDCAVPGLPEDLCGADGQCIGLNRDLSFCAAGCKDGDDCASGYACADDDQDATTPRICYPACFDDADCGSDATCELDPSAGLGSCVASGT